MFGSACLPIYKCVNAPRVQVMYNVVLFTNNTCRSLLIKNRADVSRDEWLMYKYCSCRWIRNESDKSRHDVMTSVREFWGTGPLRGPSAPPNE